MKIKSEIKPPKSLIGFSSKKLAELIVDSIKETGYSIFRE
jgi:hypothetical protein